MMYTAAADVAATLLQCIVGGTQGAIVADWTAGVANADMFFLADNANGTDRGGGCGQ